ncbi:MAG: AAA family ATPase [Bacteroidota bacterium]
MGWKIADLELPDKSYSYKDSTGKVNDTFANLSKINIIVGENNCGKSRLIRQILSAKELRYSPADFDLTEVSGILERSREKLRNHFRDRHIAEEGVQTRIAGLPKIERISDASDLQKPFQELKAQVERLIGHVDRGWGGGVMYTHDHLGKDLSKLISESMTYKGKPLDEWLVSSKFKKIYIPILRGLYSSQFLPSGPDYYENLIREFYFKGASGDFEVFTGLGIYNRVKEYQSGNQKQRRQIDAFEEYLAHQFFDNNPVELVPSGANQLLTIKIGAELERPIYDLGDGIQSVIIVTFPLFLHTGENVLAFIEEPEQLLHPGLQRRIIDTLSHYPGFENHQFFFTTHSNHFLDITLDFSNISVFTIRKLFDQKEGNEKVPKFLIENVSQGDEKALGLLGVRNSSVFLSNCTIWVEGITDRHYVRRFLELYQMHLHSKGTLSLEAREDYHYSFVEFGGSNVTHWSFLDCEEKPIDVRRLCGKLLLIIDRDNGTAERQKKLKEFLGDRCVVLERREIENLLPPSVLVKVVKEYEQVKEDEEFQYNEFKYEDYAECYLGEFIEGKVLAKKKRKGSYKMDSGTISDKRGFCERAMKQLNRWEDLSVDAQHLTEKIYDFILLNNNG